MQSVHGQSRQVHRKGTVIIFSETYSNFPPPPIKKLKTPTIIYFPVQELFVFQ